MSTTSQDDAPTWLSFRGQHDEDVAQFIQAVQRAAFSQSRDGDDTWCARYAETAFEDAALSWFIDLPDNVQASWRQLRRALMARFRALDATESTTSPSPTRALVLRSRATPTNTMAPPAPDIAENSCMRLDPYGRPREGRIMVIDRESGAIMGHVGQTPGTPLVRDVYQSLIVVLPDSTTATEPYHLSAQEWKSVVSILQNHCSSRPD